MTVQEFIEHLAEAVAAGRIAASDGLYCEYQENTCEVDGVYPCGDHAVSVRAGDPI